MAEVFGTVAGAVSVAAVFNNCVECFEYIQLGRHFGRDFERCQLKLDIARLRLGRWGQAVAIVDDPRFTTHSPDPSSQQVQVILEQIQLLFQTLQKSSKRYEIRATTEELVRFEESDMGSVAQRLHGWLGVVAQQRQKHTSLVKKASWALYDGKNFEHLVGQITGFVDDLEKLFPAAATRHKLVEQEINMVDDEPSLLALQDAASGIDSVLSEAVARKLEALARTNYAGNIQSDENAKVRVGNEWNETALARGVSVADRTTNSVGRVVARGASRVHIGTTYGGPGIFD